jgi:energy-coupling factor transport system permease protein
VSAVTRKLLAGLSYGYRPSAGPLASVRVEVALAWFGTALLTAMLFDSPLALAAVVAATLAVAWMCGALRRMRAVMLLSLPIVLLAALINPLVVREGQTVVIEAAWLPLLGTFDVTLEAIIYGIVLGLRAFTVVLLAALYVAVVDPDQVLRLLRRFSVRSAITATLASRLVPLLARDGLAMATARECRPGADPGSAAIVRSAFARSFERTEEAALALELRGYSIARRRRPPRRRLTGDEWALLGGAAGTSLASITLLAAGILGIDPYPVMRIDAGLVDAAAAFALAALTAGPPAVVWSRGRRRGSTPGEEAGR